GRLLRPPAVDRGRAQRRHRRPRRPLRVRPALPPRRSGGRRPPARRAAGLRNRPEGPPASPVEPRSPALTRGAAHLVEPSVAVTAAGTPLRRGRRRAGPRRIRPPGTAVPLHRTGPPQRARVTAGAEIDAGEGPGATGPPGRRRWSPGRPTGRRPRPPRCR